SQPENRGTAPAESSVPGDVYKRGNSCAVGHGTECRHRRRRQTFLARGSVIFIDVFGHRPRATTAREGDERWNYLRVAEQTEPLDRLASGLLGSRVGASERGKLRNHITGIGEHRRKQDSGLVSADGALEARNQIEEESGSLRRRYGAEIGHPLIRGHPRSTDEGLDAGHLAARHGE